jgi:protein-tyrosine phosphatase
VQITASAYTGKWGKPIQKLAHWYAEQGLVHVLASDAHSPNSRRPGLSEARKAFGKSFGEDYATRVVETNPLAIVRGQELP